MCNKDRFFICNNHALRTILYVSRMIIVMSGNKKIAIMHNNCAKFCIFVGYKAKNDKHNKTT